MLYLAFARQRVNRLSSSHFICLRGQHNTVLRGTVLLAGCGLSRRDLNQDWMDGWHRVIIITDNYQLPFTVGSFINHLSLIRPSTRRSGGEVWQTIFVRLKKKTLLIGMMKTDAYKVGRVMPREAASCTAILTESLLRSS